MGNPQEVVDAIKKGLEPYVKPRAEVAHIRTVLAAHLSSCVRNGPVTNPLALVDPSCEVKPSPDIRGIQRDYLEALRANVQAQREYASVREECARGPLSAASSAQPGADSRLEDYVTALKLQKKRERLEVIIKYFDLLGEKPAASPEFLEPDEVFKDCDPLPAVPKEVVSGFALDKDVAKTDLRGLVTRLEKAVLRSKMLLKREEQLLGEVKSRASAQPGAVSDAAKLAALSSTRNELINWIETELGKVAGDEGRGPEGAGTGGGAGQAVDKGRVDEQLASIKERYAQYLGARKSLVQLVGQSPQPTINPPAGQQESAEPISEPRQPTTHLLTPYIESLLQAAHEQKVSIAEKSHLSNTLAKQVRDTCQVLDHLAEESQLLPAHPPPGSVQKMAALGSGLGGPGSEKVSDSVKGWVYAADSAKIATLENVTEQIEEGQLALEASTTALDEIDYLLRRDKPGPDGGAPGAAEDDIWLGEAEPRGAGAAARKHTRGKSGSHKADGGIWSVLDGNLGLINSHDSST